MISELYTDDLVIYTVNKREVKKDDDTALYKFLRDRQKARNWLTHLLKHNEVVIFYIEEDDNTEQFVIGTLQGYDPDAFDVPMSLEEWRGKKYDAIHHVPFISLPDKTPYYIHVDDITRFICKNDKITEISNSISLLF